jgi:hypothetical protein
MMAALGHRTGLQIGSKHDRQRYLGGTIVSYVDSDFIDRVYGQVGSRPDRRRFRTPRCRRR